MTNINKVEEFQKLMEQPVNYEPKLLNKERAYLRLSLLKEEIKELEDAIKNDDIIEIADALGDIEYILHGTSIEYGLTNISNKIFDNIHNSNMSKTCKNIQDVFETMEYYVNERGLNNNEVTYRQLDNKEYLVFRKDGKVLKNVNYTPVNIKQILENV